MEYPNNLSNLISASSRLNEFISQKNLGSYPYKAHQKRVNDYILACECDAKNVLEFLIEHLGADIAGANITCSIDHNKFHLYASVSHINTNHFHINLSVGTFMSIDDWAMAVSPYYKKGSSGLGNSLLDKFHVGDPNWIERFYDYSDPESRDRQLFGDLAFKQVNEVSRTLSNLMLCWVIMHELAHVALGHLGSEINILALSRINQPIIKGSGSTPLTEEENISMQYANEIHCDFFASLSVYSLLKYINPNVEYIQNNETLIDRDVVLFLIVNCGIYVSIMFHKGDVWSSSSSETHPLPLTRFYNGLVAFEFYNQYILERVSPSLIDYLNIDCVIRIYYIAIYHMYFCALMVFGEDFDPTKSNRKIDLVDMSNFITYEDTVKWILSIWSSRFATNFFLEEEEVHKHIAQWNDTWRTLFLNSAHAFGDAPERGKVSIFSELQFAAARAPAIYYLEAKHGLDEAFKAAKFFADVIIINSIISNMRGE